MKPIAHCHDGIAKVFMFTALLLGLIVGDSCSRVSSNSSLSNGTLTMVHGNQLNQLFEGSTLSSSI